MTTAAVRPAALEALPDVYTARGLNSSTRLVEGEEEEEEEGKFGGRYREG